MFNGEDRINSIRQGSKGKIHYHIHQPQLPGALFASFMERKKELSCIQPARSRIISTVTSTDEKAVFLAVL